MWIPSAVLQRGTSAIFKFLLNPLLQSHMNPPPRIIPAPRLRLRGGGVLCLCLEERFGLGNFSGPSSRWYRVRTLDVGGFN